MLKIVIVFLCILKTKTENENNFKTEFPTKRRLYSQYEKSASLFNNKRKLHAPIKVSKGIVRSSTGRKREFSTKNMLRDVKSSIFISSEKYLKKIVTPYSRFVPGNQHNEKIQQVNSFFDNVTYLQKKKNTRLKRKNKEKISVNLRKTDVLSKEKERIPEIPSEDTHDIKEVLNDGPFDIIDNLLEDSDDENENDAHENVQISKYKPDSHIELLNHCPTHKKDETTEKYLTPEGEFNEDGGVSLIYSLISLNTTLRPEYRKCFGVSKLVKIVMSPNTCRTEAPTRKTSVTPECTHTTSETVSHTKKNKHKEASTAESECTTVVVKCKKTKHHNTKSSKHSTEKKHHHTTEKKHNHKSLEKTTHTNIRPKKKTTHSLECLASSNEKSVHSSPSMANPMSMENHDIIGTTQHVPILGPHSLKTTDNTDLQDHTSPGHTSHQIAGSSTKHDSTSTITTMTTCYPAPGTESLNSTSYLNQKNLSLPNVTSTWEVMGSIFASTPSTFGSAASTFDSASNSIITLTSTPGATSSIFASAPSIFDSASNAGTFTSTTSATSTFASTPSIIARVEENGNGTSTGTVIDKITLFTHSAQINVNQEVMAGNSSQEYGVNRFINVFNQTRVPVISITSATLPVNYREGNLISRPNQENFKKCTDLPNKSIPHGPISIVNYKQHFVNCSLKLEGPNISNRNVEEITIIPPTTILTSPEDTPPVTTIPSSTSGITQNVQAAMGDTRRVGNATNLVAEITVIPPTTCSTSQNNPRGTTIPSYTSDMTQNVQAAMGDTRRVGNATNLVAEITVIPPTTCSTSPQNNPPGTTIPSSTSDMTQNVQAAIGDTRKLGNATSLVAEITVIPPTTYSTSPQNNSLSTTIPSYTSGITQNVQATMEDTRRLGNATSLVAEITVIPPTTYSTSPQNNSLGTTIPSYTSGMTQNVQAAMGDTREVGNATSLVAKTTSSLLAICYSPDLLNSHNNNSEKEEDVDLLAGGHLPQAENASECLCKPDMVSISPPPSKAFPDEPLFIDTLFTDGKMSLGLCENESLLHTATVPGNKRWKLEDADV